MKANIDLTENRDFIPKFKIPSFNKTRFNMLQDNDYYYKDKGFILQGNSEIRRSKKLYSEFSKGNICDCCGKELKPYYYDTLCEKCLSRKGLYDR